MKAQWWAASLESWLSFRRQGFDSSFFRWYAAPMCGLCQLQHVFGDPLQGSNPVDAIKERAVRLKRIIRLHERYVEKHQCEETAERLKVFRAEQYELSRNL